MGKKRAEMKKILVLILMVSLFIIYSGNVSAVPGGGDQGTCGPSSTQKYMSCNYLNTENKCYDFLYICTPYYYCNGIEPFFSGTYDYDHCLQPGMFEGCGCPPGYFSIPSCHQQELGGNVYCSDIHYLDLCTSPCTWTPGGGGTNDAPVLDHIGDKSVVLGQTLTFSVSARDPDPDYLFFIGFNLPAGANITQGSLPPPPGERGIIESVATATVKWTPNSSQVGVYTGVNITVTDFRGGEDSERITITVSNPPNQPPVASIVPTPTSGNAPLTVNFDGSGSYDSDGTIVSYNWIFGDGNTGSGANVNHIYQNMGNYNATLTVTDDDGATGTASVIIPVNCGGCLIAGVCYNNNDANPSNACQYCDIAISRTTWSNYDSTHACTISGCNGRCNGEGMCADQGPTVTSDRFTGPCTPSSLAYACTESDRENELVSSKVWVGKCSGTCNDIEWNYINDQSMIPVQGGNQEYVSNNFNLVKDLTKPKLVADCKLEEVCNPSKVATSRRICTVDCAGSGPQLSSPAATNMLGPDLGISTITFLSPFNDLNPLTDIQVEVTPGGSGVGRGELGGLGGMNPTYNARFVRVELAGVNYRYVYEFDVLNTYKTGTADVLITATRQGCSGSISTQFQLFYCVINSASIAPANCDPAGCVEGKQITLSATISGDCSRYGINFLQIDADSNMPVGGEIGFIGLKPKMLNENQIQSENFGGMGPEPIRGADGVCNIQLTDSYLIDVIGMNNDIVIPPGFIQNHVVSIDWIIPAWKDLFAKQDCSGKTIYPIAVGLYYKAIGMPPLYVGKVFFNDPTGSFVFKDLNTNMLCGIPYINATLILNKTCDDTQPPDKKAICNYSTDCVYADEVTGEGDTCFIAGAPTTNREGKEILCSNEQHWCPTGFRYDPFVGYCIFGTLKCDEGYEQYLSCNKFPPQYNFNLTKPCLFSQLGKYTQGCCIFTEWSGYKIYATQNVKIY